MEVHLILAFLLGAASGAAAAAAQNCSFDSSRTLVFCRVSRWSPWLLYDDPRLNRSDVASLYVHILTESFPLTQVHLRGFTNLRSLLVRGSCPFSQRFKWCSDAVGLPEIDFDAFDEVPKLEKLRLELHPLRDLTPLSRLRNLRILQLKWLKNLTKIAPEAVRSSRASLEEVFVWYTSLSELPNAVFDGFPRLRVLEICSAYRLDLGSRAISNLPALRSLLLSFFLGHGLITLDRWALSNLSHLQEVGIYAVKNITVVSEPACAGDAAVRELTLQSCDLGLLAVCPLFLQCPSCPEQTVTIRSSFLSDRASTSLLPQLKSTPTFNITRLELYQTSFIYPFGMFVQLPHLKTLIIEHSMGGKPAAESFRRLPKFFNNPFALLPASVRLREVRMTMRSCGCLLLDIFQWMRENAQASNRTLQETFFLDCLQIDFICNEGQENRRKYNYWLDISLVEPLLKEVCPGGGEATEAASPVPALEKEELKCMCTDIKSCLGVTNVTTATAEASHSSSSSSSSLLFLIFLATILLG